ncbi:HutP family protein [Clostridiisalibacter paucivorans]|uniref:HutP family protein n=1 Tax=Clostridiisalibacter paucivorans TaxID=408753 RepID=UPI00047928B3|nr:HutP family protein [Clostridiisalibacter paucivorans]
MNFKSTDVGKASVNMAISSRAEEERLIKEYKSKGMIATAVDIGGDLIASIPKIIERAIVSSKRCGLIEESHIHEGAVVGATREAIMQVGDKAHGFSVGGKIGIARSGEHISVCIFLSIGLLHLDEVAIGLGHRSIPIIK